MAGVARGVTESGSFIFGTEECETVKEYFASNVSGSDRCLFGGSAVSGNV